MNSFYFFLIGFIIGWIGHYINWNKLFNDLKQKKGVKDGNNVNNNAMDS